MNASPFACLLASLLGILVLGAGADHAEGQFQALLAALQQHVLQAPTNWLELPGQARAGRPIIPPPSDIPSNDDGHSST